MNSSVKSLITRDKLTRYLVTALFLFLSFLALYKVYSTFIYTFGFTDEGDNISIGKFILQDKKLYQDVLCFSRSPTSHSA
jgi:hypothetical protein